MNILEVLKVNGVDDELATKIMADMKANKIYTASEENLDIRYGKVKNDLAIATSTIGDLQTKLEATKDLQTRLDSAVAENERIRIDHALDRALIEANVGDVDYMKFKIKENNADGFKLDANGKIENMNDLLDGLKVQFPTQFTKTEKKIEEKKLDKTDEKSIGVTVEQFNSMNYHEKAKLFKENPEQYAELNKNK